MGQAVTLQIDSRPLNAGKMAILADVATMYAAAVRWFLAESKSFELVSRTALNRQLYATARETFPLQATLVQTALQDALQIRRGCLTAMRKGSGYRAGRVGEPSVSDGIPITFRQDAWSLIETRGGLSIRVPTRATGRGTSSLVAIPLVLGDYHHEWLRRLRAGTARKASLTLALRADGTCRLGLTLDVPVEPPAEGPSAWLGVDLGIANVAVTSTGRFHGGREYRYRKNRWQERRMALQSHGRLGRVKAERGHEASWVRDTNHKIAKRLVEEAQGMGAGLALENLTGFHGRVGSKGRKLNRMNHGWSFSQLREFVLYKAALAGVPVVFVDPRGTSRTCSKCGYEHAANRVDQATFRCRSCGYELHADLNAAHNIAARAAATYARQAGLAGKGECDTPKGSRPPASLPGPAQADLFSSRFERSSSPTAKDVVPTCSLGTLQ